MYSFMEILLELGRIDKKQSYGKNKYMYIYSVTLIFSIKRLTSLVTKKTKVRNNQHPNKLTQISNFISLLYFLCF